MMHAPGPTLPGMRAWHGFHWSFLVATAVVVAAVAADPWLSSLVSISFWQRLGLEEFPLKVSLFIPLVALALAAAGHFAGKAPDLRGALLVLTIIALQSNGIKLLPGLDLITLLPFLVFLYVLAEALRLPGNRIELGAVMFFAFLLLLLDLPYLATPHVYGPPRFIINFISALKAFLVAFVFINLIRSERHFDLAIRSILVVAAVSAFLGVAQIAVNYYTGATFTLVSEEHTTKPTFLGTMMRASGLTTWSSWLADFLVLAFPFFLFRLFDAGTWRARLMYLSGIAVLLGAVFFTFTYAAYAGVAVIAFLFPFFRWPRLIPVFVATLLCAGALFQLVGGFEWAQDLFVRKVLGSTGMIERKVYLQAALDQLTRDPWLGSGFYADEEFSGNFYRKRVHNTGIQAWAYLGFPGFVAFMSMMLIVYTQLWLLAGTHAGRVRQSFVALGLGMTGMIVEMFAEPNLTAPVTWYFLGLCQAAILVFNRPGQPRLSG